MKFNIQLFVFVISFYRIKMTIKSLKSKWRWNRLTKQNDDEIELKFVFVISFYKTKQNEIENLTCNCLYVSSNFIKKKRSTCNHDDFLIVQFDENISKSIQKYCKSIIQTKWFIEHRNQITKF